MPQFTTHYTLDEAYNDPSQQSQLKYIIAKYPGSYPTAYQGTRYIFYNIPIPAPPGTTRNVGSLRTWVSHPGLLCLCCLQHLSEVKSVSREKVTPAYFYGYLNPLHRNSIYVITYIVRTHRLRCQRIDSQTHGRHAALQNGH